MAEAGVSRRAATHGRRRDGCGRERPNAGPSRRL